MNRASAFAAAALGAIMATPGNVRHGPAKILVGPNVQVSTDGNMTHDEFMLAANPIDPDNLVGATHVGPTIPGNFKETKVYVTRDGGRTWFDRSFPEQMADGGGDPQAAFGLHGTAYFLTISSRQPDAPLAFYRSVDKGMIWERPTFLSPVLYGLPTMQDHEQIGVDHSFGPFAGRVYFTAMEAGPDETGDLRYHLWLYRSDDDGKTFVGPIKFMTGRVGAGLNVTNTMVSSRGTLFLTFNEWYNDTTVRGAYGGGVMTTYLVKSEDGGVTFSPPIRVVGYRGGGHCQWAIDNHDGKYRDRLYYVYNDDDDDKHLKLYFTYSSDGGTTWSRPKLVDTGRPAEAQQHTPAVTVNAQGVVGVRWYDTRHTQGFDGYDEYFAASVDGGETFLPAVRVSSVTSHEPHAQQNYQSGSPQQTVRLGIPIWRRTKADSIRLEFEPAVQSLGHHYYQFTADPTGIFHDFWADSRDGRARQVYTAAIRVIPPGADTEKITAEFEKKYGTPETVGPSPKRKVLRRLTSDVFLAIDEAEYDTLTSTLSFAMRLRNVSTRPIFGPLTVKLARIDTEAKLPRSCQAMANPPTEVELLMCSRTPVEVVVLNAANRAARAGAEFTYPPNQGVVLPGHETEPITWRLRVSIPHKFFKGDSANRTDPSTTWFTSRLAGLMLEVTGFVDGDSTR